MKDIYYFIGFMTIGFHIYRFMYNDYINFKLNEFKKLDRDIQKQPITTQELKTGFLIFFEIILPKFISISWFFISLFTFNWIVCGFILILSFLSNIYKCYSDIWIKIFSLLYISVIMFSIYNTYYLKFDLFNYFVSLI